MKRGLSFLLSIIFLFSGLSMIALAEDTAGDETQGGEPFNVARVENAMAYASSEKNTSWTPSAALNDGAYSKDTWQGWECRYPDIIYGADTSAGFSGQYFGIKFTNKEYYEIHDIYINMGLHAAMGGQNAHFTVQFFQPPAYIGRCQRQIPFQFRDPVQRSAVLDDLHDRFLHQSFYMSYHNTTIPDFRILYFNLKLVSISPLHL